MSGRGRDYGRGEQLDRAIRLIRALQMRPQVGLTIEQLAEELGCSRRTAYRWMEVASLTLPIVRVTERPTRYRLIHPDAHKTRA